MPPILHFSKVSPNRCVGPAVLLVKPWRRETTVFRAHSSHSRRSTPRSRGQRARRHPIHSLMDRPCHRRPLLAFHKSGAHLLLQSMDQASSGYSDPNCSFVVAGRGPQLLPFGVIGVIVRRRIAFFAHPARKLCGQLLTRAGRISHAMPLHETPGSP